MNPTFVAVASEAARKAGAIQKARMGAGVRIEHKGAIDLVTDVDRECEKAVLEILGSRFPDHDIVTEESEPERKGSSHVWYVDPIDGTTNFAHGYPFFCSSISLVIDGELAVGAVYDPLRQEVFTGERGEGAYLNGRRIRVTETSELLQSLLITGFPYDIHDNLQANVQPFNRLIAKAQAVRRDGSAALDLCYVAAGRVEGFWESQLQQWDIYAGAVILQEAGGRVTRYDGSPLDMTAPGQVLASNGRIHQAMMDVLSEPITS